MTRPPSARRVLLTVAFVATAAAGMQASADGVREEMLRTWIHGVDDALAERVVGAEGIDELRALLLDPAFPRRDNVVAFLAHLDRGRAVDGLAALLRRPPAGVDRPAEDRAVLLVPSALGRIASRGSAEALAILVELTDPATSESRMSGALAASGAPEALRADLIEAAIGGLELSGSPEAQRRLEAIRDGRAPLPETARPLGAAVGRATGGAEDERPGFSGDGGATVRAADARQREHALRITYANHVGVTSPMTDARVDAVLELGTRRFGIADFAADIACCVQLRREGSAASFGSAGDGLDVIDTETELYDVLDQGAARVKIVRLIQYCGAPCTNCIGCAWQPGDGMVLVRQSDLQREAVLWAHELGHNTGLPHVDDSRYIMYGTDNGANRALSQDECDSYHAPSGISGLAPVDLGACTDADVDEVQDGIDNCPTVPNYDQLDVDGDGTGDACESIGVPGDANLSGRVDGFDLAQLARAFGASVGQVRYDAAVDFDSSGQVDGSDLSILAANFGRNG